MYKKKLAKIYAGCALAMALSLAAAPSAFAANTEVNTVSPGTDDTGKTAKADDPTKREKLDPTAEDDPSTDDKNEAYTDTDIDVWGFTKDGTVYSVDVEWGAMTFMYEKSSWDPETHKAKDGAGWQVYDNANDKELGDVQNAINRVTVTNHSNASVYAKMAYAGETDYADTTGTFAASEKAADEDVKATWNTSDNYLSLKTAATDKEDNAVAADAAGTPSVGNVYFKPAGIADSVKTSGIAKWTKIGKITVSLLTEEPTAATP